jgi:hypothetical protein
MLTYKPLTNNAVLRKLSVKEYKLLFYIVENHKNKEKPLYE